MSNFEMITACRLCGGADLVPVLSLGEQYLTGVFPRSPNESISRGPLELVKCAAESGGCGLVQLRHSYNSAEMYGANYGYRSSLNRSMVSHLRDKVAYLESLVVLREGDVVLDVGSNDGTTLSFYPDSLERVGMDPTAAKFRDFYKPGIHVIPDFFSAHAFDTAVGGSKAKIVSSIAMLYDLEHPLDFAREIESILADDGIWHFEQSYLPSMLDTTGYDTICHEHVEYYTLSQIDWMIRKAGLRIVDVVLNDVNGGSFGVTVCKADYRLAGNGSQAAHLLECERRRKLDTMDPYRRFADCVQRHRENLNELLTQLNREGATVLGYGASTKGNVLLQYCGIGADRLPFIAEVNQDKIGSYTPGTLIPIISEAEAHAMKPDYFLVMPWHFRQNLLEREQAYLSGGGRMIFPLPQLDIALSPES